MGLEIRDELGTSQENLRSLNSVSTAKIEKIVVNNIHGSGNFLAFGNMLVDESTTKSLFVRATDNDSTRF